MSDFEKFSLQPHSLELTKSKVPVAYGRNSMSDLASSSYAGTNDVDGRIANKTWCKRECCASMETGMEISEICKPRFSGTLYLHICRSDPHFILRYSMQEKSINHLISAQIRSLPNQEKTFILIKTSSFFFNYFTVLITSISL